MKQTFVTCQGESTLLELIGVGVDSCPSSQQNPGHAHMSSTGRLHQGCVSILIMLFNVGSGF